MDEYLFAIGVAFCGLMIAAGYMAAELYDRWTK